MKTIMRKSISGVRRTSAGGQGYPVSAALSIRP